MKGTKRWIERLMKRITLQEEAIHNLNVAREACMKERDESNRKLRASRQQIHELKGLLLREQSKTAQIQDSKAKLDEAQRQIVELKGSLDLSNDVLVELQKEIAKAHPDFEIPDEAIWERINKPRYYNK